MLNKVDYPGKSDDVQTCDLNFCITPVITVDNRVYVANTIQQEFDSALDHKLEFFSELLFKIQLDQETLLETKFQNLNPIHLLKKLNDLDQKNHELLFVLQGKNNNHSCFLGDDKKSVTLSIQIDFNIEQLPTNTLFYELGTYITDEHGVQSASTIMGVNGKQILHFPSPVYPWLLDNSKHVLSDLRAMRT